MRKVYGMNQSAKCPFCGSNAYSKNEQNIPTCKDHKDQILEDMKCACGEVLELREGKYGMFYVCEKCGTKSMSKAISITPPKVKEKEKVVEEVVMPGDPRYFD